jgi:hypothetical protein
MSWKPIETAPKDGTQVDLWIQWSSIGARYANSYYADGQWTDREGDAICAYDVVTHWMPLPQPPAGGAEAGRVETTAGGPASDPIKPIISQATGST